MNDKLKQFYKNFSGKNQNALSLDAKQRVKNKVLQRLSEVPEELPESVSMWSKLRHSMFMKSYVLAPLLLVLFVISATAVSANAVPGDVLYPIKRQVETARILLAPTPEAKLELELNFAEERIHELEKVQTLVNSGSSNSKEVEVTQEDTNNNQTRTFKKDSSDSKEAKNDSDTEDKELSNNSSEHNKSAVSDREVRARKQAEGALQFLKDTENQYKEKEDHKRAEDLNKKIEDYQKRLREGGEHKDEDRHEDRSGKDKDSMKNLKSEIKISTDGEIKLDILNNR